MKAAQLRNEAAVKASIEYSLTTLNKLSENLKSLGGIGSEELTVPGSWLYTWA